MNVHEKGQLPKQSSEIWRKGNQTVIGPKPRGEGWEAFTLPGHIPYGTAMPNRRHVQPFSIGELLSIYDANKGDWCAIARAVEQRYIQELEATRAALAAALFPQVPMGQHKTDSTD